MVISILNWLSLKNFKKFSNNLTFTWEVGAALVMHSFLVINNSIITVAGSLLRLEGVVPFPDERCLISQVKLRQSNVISTMWLLGGGAARPAQQRPCRGPAILSTPDGAMPSVQVITHNFSTTPRKRGLAEWVWTLTGQNRQNREKVDPGGELQIMLPAQPDKPTSGEVCLLAESPFRILRLMLVDWAARNAFTCLILTVAPSIFALYRSRVIFLGEACSSIALAVTTRSAY
ncbi:unnamed protein product [Spodoptera littoralis]|uniref:Uncharacterized protein n=1 Tax=Spodoptera littoralis TaxID=7109 RepID=A0A9P0IKJ5_SPOLI|nr:unnamed protein product [Spodoptera littoralis]CAH1647464.1 unnamed protein product [Spodoptera littoralis]